MGEFNPYAAPLYDDLVDLDAPLETGVWRDGSLLVMTRNSALPDRCLKCNTPAGGWTLKRKLWWHAPGWYLLILFHLLIYVIAALIVRKSAVVHLPLCAKHRSRRRHAIILGWVFSLLGIGVICAAAASNGDELFGPGLLAGAIMTIGGMIYGIVGSRVAVVQKIDDRFVWLKKVAPAFLAELPVWKWAPSH